MFDIGWSELLVIGVVALIVIGPKELPGVLRMVGQWITKVRRMASEFQGQFQEAMREAEMADLKKQVDDIANSTRDLTSQFDPIGSMQDVIGDPFEEKKKPAEATADNPPAEAADQAALPQSEQPVSDSALEPAQAAPEPATPPVDDAQADAEPPPRKAAGGHSA
jgi:sec-independent protein translocase protein TatB